MSTEKLDQQPQGAKDLPHLGPFDEWATNRRHAYSVLTTEMSQIRESCSVIDAAVLELLQDSDGDESEGVNWTREALARIASASSMARAMAKVETVRTEDHAETASDSHALHGEQHVARDEHNGKNPSDSDLARGVRQAAEAAPTSNEPKTSETHSGPDLRTLAESFGGNYGTHGKGPVSPFSAAMCVIDDLRRGLVLCAQAMPDVPDDRIGPAAEMIDSMACRAITALDTLDKVKVSR